MKTIDARFEIKNAGPDVGEGLFATQDIRKGDLIIEYTGEKLPTAVADARDSRYLFELDDEWTLDGSGTENTARYINHSCDPNSEAEIRHGRIMIDAVRDIKAGEEITFDYDQEYFDEFIKPIGCRCGAKVHRK
ncbi:MAG: nuclear protein [Candidatus Kaiserbacteria bacterium]|nr:nuclear protein [Candidatus Kaiserbacteria bacterium]